MLGVRGPQRGERRATARTIRVGAVLLAAVLLPSRLGAQGFRTVGIGAASTGAGSSTCPSADMSAGPSGWEFRRGRAVGRCGRSIGSVDGSFGAIT
jgi:hypothetical protein